MTRDKWTDYSKSGVFPSEISDMIAKKNEQKGLDINHHWGYYMVFQKLVNNIPYNKAEKMVRVSRYREEIIYPENMKIG